LHSERPEPVALLALAIITEGSVEVSDVTTLDEVRALVATTLGIEDRAASFDASTELIGGIPEFDSMAVVEVVTALERHFGLEFDDDDITGDSFETLGSLTAVVDSKRRIE
jgi:acyl carrier protein